MADVAARLAQGLPAVENTSTYVSACRSLGFAGVADDALREQYGTEDGLDLAALQSDSDALARAAATADDAARLQSALTARLAGAWSGAGGVTADDVLRRQTAAADAARDALRDAAAATSALRDGLWAAVDAKVDAVLDVDDRPAGERAEWLDAAHTVTTGAGDLATASELVDQRVKPFVDNDIGAELLTEMRASFDRVTSAFDAAIARLEGCPPATFDPPTGARGAGDPLGATVPAAATPPIAPVAPPAAPELGGMGGGMPSLGSGMSGLSGLSGFGQQLADLIGGFTGGGLQDDTGSGLDDEFDDLEEPEEQEGPGEEEDDEAEDPPAEDEPPAEDPPAEDEPPEEPTAEEPSAEVVPPPPVVTEPPPPPPVAVPVPVPAAVPEALPAEKTPCEIAAEELPSVGE